MEACLIKWSDKNGVRWFFKKNDYESIEFENYSEGENILREDFNQGIFTKEEYDFLFWIMYEDYNIPKPDTTEVYGEISPMQKFPLLHSLCYN